MILQTIELPVWVETIILLKTGLSLQQIVFFQQRTYSHVHKIVATFVEKGWIIREGKVGREMKYSLSSKGLRIIAILEDLLSIIQPDLDVRLIGIENYEEDRKRE